MKRHKSFYTDYRFIYPLIAFIGALIAYWSTVDSGASYWDCPEYLISALRLEIGHPPGNPGWTLTHRFASSLFQNPAHQVLVVNMMSGLFTALSVMLLCTVCMTIMRRVLSPGIMSGDKNISDTRRRLNHSIGITSLAGSLCFAWSDSAWYSAVEAEVYAMSLFLSALTIWMALRWTFSFSSGERGRWLVALAFIMGFSLGVHQLNLLALPAIAMIMASGVRRWRKHLWIRRLSAFFVGCVAVGVILKVIMPGSVALVRTADIFAVNSFGFPFWTGAIAAWILAFVSVVVLAILFTPRSRNTGVAFWCLAAIMTGFSVYIIIPIRANANPPVNEGNPSSVGSFADYLDRRQYGGAPLFYGRTPNSRIMRQERISLNEKGDTVYDYSWNAMKMKRRDMRPMISGAHIPDRSRFLTEEDKMLNRRLSADSMTRGYAVAGFITEPIYTPELNMLMPRIHSSSPGDIKAYGDWTGMDSANMVRVRISEAFDSLGNPVAMRDAAGRPIEKYSQRPSYLHSLSYMLGYQIGYMYLRYLLWNYSGRQNDCPSTGEIDHGNFITGIAPLDNLMLGNQSALPEEIGAANKGHNVYWMIPFLLGLIGVFWLFFASGKGLSHIEMRNAAWYLLALFIMTGMAIVVYLNQSPGEPRERDYTFLGSFWTFAIWIAMGMLCLLLAAKRNWQRYAAMAFVCAVPLWMLAENYDDHDRRGRSATLDYAENLLMSLDKDAIIIVDGDNYIFPLWFAQEVMGIRPDVSVVCNSFLACDWYLPQLMTGHADGEGIAMTATEGDVAMGNYNQLRLPRQDADTISAVAALNELYSDMSAIPQFKHRWLVMGKDSSDSWIFDLLSIPGKNANSIAGLRELAIVDMVATNAASRYPRPIYWHQGLGKNKFYGFFPYTRQGLMARRLMPNSPDSLQLTEESLNALPLMKWGGIDEMQYPGPDVASQAVLQRASLIRLGQALASEGHHDMALHVAKMAMVRYPSKIIPYGIRNHCDSAYFEAPQLASLLIESGEMENDTAAILEGYKILRDDSLRVESYLRYRREIPKSRRNAISPTTNNHSIHKFFNTH